MKIWIVTIYEPLPFGNEKTRPHRCGMLANALLDRGHDIELWTSAFDHISHKHIYQTSFFEKIDERMSIQFIKGCGYPSDLHPRRFWHNRQTGKEYTELANRRDDSPDIIFTQVPILELAQAAVNYASQRNIPVIVDVRDLWPDVYLTMIPKVLHSFGKIFLYGEYQKARNIFKKATGITAVSKAYLQKGLCYAGRPPQNTDRFFPLGSEEVVNIDLMQQKNTKGSVIEQYTIEPNQFVVTYVGTFNKFCDIQNILDAAESLVGNEKIRIFIVGAGERSKEFHKAATRLPNVTMTGWLNSKAIRSILGITDVGLAAYAKDALMSLPNKPFEYMAARLPLLSSLSGELEQLILKYGIGRQYEAGNPMSLADGIRWFYEHQQVARQMGVRSYALFAAKFKSDIVYKDFSQYIEGIIS